MDTDNINIQTELIPFSHAILYFINDTLESVVKHLNCQNYQKNWTISLYKTVQLPDGQTQNQSSSNLRR
jgi:hypothetical protein